MIKKLVSTIGTLYNAECKCGFTAKLFEGAGKNAKNRDMITKVMDAEIIPQFEAIKPSLKKWYIKNQVIRCRVCRTLRTVSSLVCTKDDDRVITFTNRCPDCGKACAPYKRIDKIPCPKCGRRLVLSPNGFWD